MGDDEFWAWQARTIHAYPLSVHWHVALAYVARTRAPSSHHLHSTPAPLLPGCCRWMC